MLELTIDLMFEPSWSSYRVFGIYRPKVNIDFISYLCFLGDFLGPFLRTFENLSYVLTFVHFYKLQTCCGKIAQKGPKWPKKVNNDPK